MGAAAELEYQALLNAGNLPAAAHQLRAIYQQVQVRAAADPANTGWQRDLSIGHDKLGDVATAARDLAGARTHYQASLDIRTTLTTADPANAQWQRDLSYVRQRIAALDGDASASSG